MWNLRCGRDEAVQDDGDCGLKPETFQIASAESMWKAPVRVGVTTLWRRVKT